jgi:CheY-like chemotaxis protein
MADQAGFTTRRRPRAQPAGFHAQPGQGGPQPVAIVAHDGAMIDFMTALMLDEGYFVLSAVDCQEALCLSRTHPGAIDVLFTDVRMPRLACTDLCSHVLAERPGIKVVVMLGPGEHGGVDSCKTPPLSPRVCDEQRLKDEVRAILAAPMQPAPYVYMVFAGTQSLAVHQGVGAAAGR